jgi:hypothetical protein
MATNTVPRFEHALLESLGKNFTHCPCDVRPQSSDAMDDLELMNAPDLFRLRTTTKPQHTNLVTRIYNMINRRASQAVFAVLSTDVEAALERITAINERYVIAGELDDQERAAAEDYIQGVAAVNRQARLAIGGYL